MINDCMSLHLFGLYFWCRWFAPRLKKTGCILCPYSVTKLQSTPPQRMCWLQIFKDLNCCRSSLLFCNNFLFVLFLFCSVKMCNSSVTNSCLALWCFAVHVHTGGYFTGACRNQVWQWQQLLHCGGLGQSEWDVCQWPTHLRSMCVAILIYVQKSWVNVQTFSQL